MRDGSLPAAIPRDARPEDAEAICAIYNPYIQDTCVSFEESAVPPEEMRRRISAHGDRYPWLVMEEDGAVVAYAYAAPWRQRQAYRYSVECSVYVASRAQRRGHGRRLYAVLFERLRAAGMHSVIAGIALPNEASVALHESMGMTQAARFVEVGRKFDQWVDVGYWQRVL